MEKDAASHHPKDAANDLGGRGAKESSAAHAIVTLTIRGGNLR